MARKWRDYVTDHVQKNRFKDTYIVSMVEPYEEAGVC